MVKAYSNKFLRERKAISQKILKFYDKKGYPFHFQGLDIIIPFSELLVKEEKKRELEIFLIYYREYQL